ncbi:MAG: DNA polymerase III subunit delta [Candidatus Nealsonbacteria bacterium]
MIILLYGKDTYRSRQKLHEIVDHYQESQKSGLNLKYFEGKKLNFQDLKIDLQITPMFEEKKLFILSDVISNAELKEGFKKELKKIAESDDTILFYESGDVKKDAFFNLLKKHSKVQEFEPLIGQKLKNWVAAEFEKHRASISSQALEYLINRVDNDLWQLSNEIQKLASFKKGEEITVKDVSLMVRPKIETDIFKTVDAIAQKNKKKALELLHEHLEKGDNPVYLFAMITRQFRNILGVKDLMEKGQPLSKAGLHPFVARKSRQQASQFTLIELKKIYRRIFKVDYSIKTGKIDSRTALDLLIAEL